MFVTGIILIRHIDASWCVGVVKCGVLNVIILILNVIILNVNYIKSFLPFDILSRDHSLKKKLSKK